MGPVPRRGSVDDAEIEPVRHRLDLVGKLSGHHQVTLKELLEAGIRLQQGNVPFVLANRRNRLSLEESRRLDPGSMLNQGGTGIGLVVQVYEENTLVHHLRDEPCQVHRQGGFSNPTFTVGHHDRNHSLFPPWGSRGSSLFFFNQSCTPSNMISCNEGIRVVSFASVSRSQFGSVSLSGTSLIAGFFFSAGFLGAAIRIILIGVNQCGLVRPLSRQFFQPLERGVFRVEPSDDCL
ncbi:hypothetical protein LMG31887_46770 (plasmid) [Xanthomonas hydrangeae]|nr:hypothetical protein LMG31887_46770 [Xanthomonas hydrangeae]CAD7748013.1 hypothetical protein LMG31887_46770 [Xanthomonas hydrangeae]